MALQYGMNITASDMKSLLEKNDKQQSGVRTWRQLFGNASLGFNAQSDALTTDYTNAIAQAYKANFEQNNAIMGAGLSAGTTRELLAQSRNDLHTAYETYVRNYGSDMSTLAGAYGEEVGAIDTALTERATNFSNLYNSAYKYLSEELFGATQIAKGNAENGAVAKYEGEGKDAEFVGYEDINRDYLTEHGLDWLYETDENGKYTDQLRAWDSISHELFANDGSLTKKGIQFFDQMFNTPYEEYTHVEGDRNIRSFDQWLSDQEDTFDNYDKNFSGMAKNGRELRDWWVSSDAFNYNFAGTNKGTSQVMTGRESTDDIYGQYEYADVNHMGALKGNADSTALDNSINAYTEKMNHFLKAYEDYLRTPATGKDGENKSKSAQADVVAARTDVENAWKDYTESVKKARDDALALLKTEVGTEMYNTFLSEYAELIGEYDIIVDITSMPSMTLSKPDEIEAFGKRFTDTYKQAGTYLANYYHKLLQTIRTYISRHGYKRTTSGF